MFSILLSHVASEYWHFNPRRKDKIIANSFDKPLFIIGYSPYCGHCTKVPNESAIFRNMTDRRKDFYFSLLNCAEGDACGHFGVPYTPYCVLVQGSEQEYWPETKSHDAVGWLEFIEEQLKPKTHELIDEEKEIEEAKNKLIDGGSLFILQVKSKTSTYLKEYMEIAKRYYIYKDLFYYRIEPKMEQKLTIYTSPNCMHETTELMKLMALIDEYRFGGAHRYTKEEMIQLRQMGQSMSLLFVEDSFAGPKIGDTHKEVITELADRYCHHMKTGWISIKSSDDFLRENKLREDDMPIMFYQDNKCTNKYMGRIYDSLETDFYNLSLSNSICNNIYYNVDSSQNVTETDIDVAAKMKGHWWDATFSGKIIFYSVYGYFLILLIISIISISPAPKPKSG